MMTTKTGRKSLRVVDESILAANSAGGMRECGGEKWNRVFKNPCNTLVHRVVSGEGGNAQEEDDQNILL